MNSLIFFILIYCFCTFSAFAPTNQSQSHVTDSMSQKTSIGCKRARSPISASDQVFEQAKDSSQQSDQIATILRQASEEEKLHLSRKGRKVEITQYQPVIDSSQLVSTPPTYSQIAREIQVKEYKTKHTDSLITSDDQDDDNHQHTSSEHNLAASAQSESQEDVPTSQYTKASKNDVSHCQQSCSASDQEVTDKTTSSFTESDQEISQQSKKKSF